MVFYHTRYETNKPRNVSDACVQIEKSQIYVNVNVLTLRRSVLMLNQIYILFINFYIIERIISFSQSFAHNASDLNQITAGTPLQSFGRVPNK